MKLKASTPPNMEDNRTHEEFMATELPITGADLYWILRRVSTEAADETVFDNLLSSLLSQRLGQNFGYVTSYDASSIWSSSNSTNSLYWYGEAGLLPGPVGSQHGVHVQVWWW